MTIDPIFAAANIVTSSPTNALDRGGAGVASDGVILAVAVPNADGGDPDNGKNNGAVDIYYYDGVGSWDVRTRLGYDFNGTTPGGALMGEYESIQVDYNPVENTYTVVAGASTAGGSTPPVPSSWVSTTAGRTGWEASGSFRSARSIAAGSGCRRQRIPRSARIRFWHAVRGGRRPSRHDSTDRRDSGRAERDRESAGGRERDGTGALAGGSGAEPGAGEAWSARAQTLPATGSPRSSSRASRSRPGDREHESERRAQYPRRST